MGKLQFQAAVLFTNGMIGIVMSEAAGLYVRTIVSAEAPGIGLVWPLPPIKNQSKPALLESTCQL